MNRLPQIVLVCLAASFTLAAGCGRKEPAQASTVQDQAPPGRQTAPQIQPGAPSTPRAVEGILPQAPSRLVSTNGDRPTKGSQFTARTLPLSDATAAHGPAQGRAGSKRSQADAIFFDTPTLLRIQIEIPPSGMTVLRRTRWEGGQDRPETKVTIREGGLVYTNVAVHLKGAAGSFRPIDNKPAFTLKFDKFVPEQSFHGLHKISLNNSVQDSSFLCEKIARELFIAAGVPVPRASHAVVELNGRYLGLYVLLEGANKQFLKRYFDDPKGNLYDGGFCRDIGSRLAANSGDEPNNHSGLKALRAAMRDPSYDRLAAALDMDRFLSMVALEVMLGHWDGYTQNKNNWRVFHDLSSNRMVFIPHGLDQLFGGGRQFDANASLLPQQIQGELTRAVLSTKEGRRHYLERCGQIYTNVFKVDAIAARIDDVAAGVSAALAEVDPQAARTLQRRAKNLKQRVILRAEGLGLQFGVPLRTVEFGRKGVLPLSGWQKSLVEAGEPVLNETVDAEGKRVLVINAGESESSGSWRTRLVLGPGSYQFEGRVRVVGVTVTDGDTRSGAGLRISKGEMPRRKLSGTSDWKNFQYAFEVNGKGASVELVCELKATGGEAWFDADSLHLVRLP